MQWGRTMILGVVTFFPLMAIGLAQEKPVAAANAYHIVFLDDAGKPLAEATVMAPELKKEDRKPFETPCRLLMLDNKSTSVAAGWFRNFLKSGDRKVAIETRKEPAFSGGHHVHINFNPTKADSNITVSMNPSDNQSAGSWGYAPMARGETGGKVTVTRVHSDIAISIPEETPFSTIGLPAIDLPK